jgi:hypothetical protein
MYIMVDVVGWVAQLIWTNPVSGVIVAVNSQLLKLNTAKGRNQ